MQYSEEELQTIIAGQEEEESAKEKKKKEGEWDCHFTDLAVITLPEGQPDADPVKVNEYVFERPLGAGMCVRMHACMHVCAYVWICMYVDAYGCTCTLFFGFYLAKRPVMSMCVDVLKHHGDSYVYMRILTYSCTSWNLKGAFGAVKLAHREVGSPPYRKYAIKMMSRHRLKRMKQSVVTGADGRMVVRTGEDMVCIVCMYCMFEHVCLYSSL